MIVLISSKTKLLKKGLVRSLDSFLDPYDCQLSKCGENMFTRMRTFECHSFPFYEDEDENEEVVLDFCDGLNELVKILNQKVVIGLESPLCESCFASLPQSIKHLVCRTK